MCEAYTLTVYSAIKSLPEANWALLDLLHKSGFEFEFQIVDGSNQIKTE